MMTLFVDGEVLVDRCKKMMDGHIKYKFGTKINLDADLTKVTGIDCSGFTKFVFYHACHAKLTGGSSSQTEWLQKNGFATVKYAEAASAKDNMLRVGYYTKPADLNAGHIWFVLNGMTLESFDGGIGHGPGRRPWDTPRLLSHVKTCFEIGYVKKVDYVAGGLGECKIVQMNVPDAFD